MGLSYSKQRTRNKQIIKDRKARDLSLYELAKKYDLTPQRIVQILKEASN